MMRRLTAVVGVAGVMGALCGSALAQGTKLWTQFALRRDGTRHHGRRRDPQRWRLQVAPATSLLYATAGNYVWSSPRMRAGNAYVGWAARRPDRRSSCGCARRQGDEGLRGQRAGRAGAAHGRGRPLYAATSPDGKVYRLPAAPGGCGWRRWSSIPRRRGEAEVIWDVAEAKATAAICMLRPARRRWCTVFPQAAAKPEVLFKTADQHIRCLLMGPDGTLWAGSDGAGVIYRFDTKSAGAKPFAAVLRRPSGRLPRWRWMTPGNVYAAGVGQAATGRRSSRLPPLPVTGAAGVTITFRSRGPRTPQREYVASGGLGDLPHRGRRQSRRSC